jgi:hypothetical protein
MPLHVPLSTYFHSAGSLSLVLCPAHECVPVFVAQSFLPAGAIPKHFSAFAGVDIELAAAVAVAEGAAATGAADDTASAFGAAGCGSADLLQAPKAKLAKAVAIITLYFFISAPNVGS